ncbi:MAG: hypothetical protein DID89_2727546980 [Candidatus Nitrotoga sp. CP45]|nr:MAG: hypothetical protein DID89_2727546980 [Candidatus Nitrotoga sp. CP45]
MHRDSRINVAGSIVTEAISMWTNVATSTVALARGADLLVDIAASNYATFLYDFWMD